MLSTHEFRIPSQVVRNMKRGGGVVLGSIGGLPDAVEPSNTDIGKSEVYGFGQNHRKAQCRVVVSFICLQEKTPFLVVATPNFIPYPVIQTLSPRSPPLFSFRNNIFPTPCPS